MIVINILNLRLTYSPVGSIFGVESSTEGNQMKRINLLLEDGTVGWVEWADDVTDEDIQSAIDAREVVEVNLVNENGIPISVSGVIAEVLE